MIPILIFRPRYNPFGIHENPAAFHTHEGSVMNRTTIKTKREKFKSSLGPLRKHQVGLYLSRSV